MPKGVLGGFKLPILREFPGIVSAEDMQQLESLQTAQKSIKVPIYEDLASRYPHPFFFGQLGCLFSGLDADALCIRWWQRCQSYLHDLNLEDPVLNILIEYSLKAFAADAVATLKRSHTIKYYQPWRKTIDHPFPTKLKASSQLHLLKRRWQALNEADRAKYMTRLVIETVRLEGVFSLPETVVHDIVDRGIDDAHIVPTAQSSLKGEATIKNILRETLTAYQYLSANILQEDGLKTSQICALHSILMKSCRFSGDTFITSGETRTTTRRTVVIGGRCPIEFCPYNMVDDELSVICDAVKARLFDAHDPLALAGWIHLIIVRCHPFDDGNGRLSRILASIPLLMLGLPPVAVLQTHATTYYDAINTAYSGNFDPLAQLIMECTDIILNDLRVR